MARKNTASKKADAPAETPAAAPVAEPVAAAVNEVVEVPPAEEGAQSSLADEFNEVLTQVTTMRTQLATLTARLRQLSSRSSRELRMAQRGGRRRKAPATGESKPNGFTKPVAVSAELSKFLGLASNDLIARTEVNKRIAAYVKEHSLQDKTNGQIIYPDDKLRKLLGVTKETKVHFFNLQRFLKQHYPKAAVATA
jgi:chromatin remodeling complex protein RSC6